jgi:K(+)-stimulated pyrophosphate-energized sodium pump
MGADAPGGKTGMRLIQKAAVVLTLAMLMTPALLAAQPEDAAHRPGGEVNIQLPDLNQGDFLGMTGHRILLSGIVVCVLGLLFGFWTYTAV